jgi:arsenate reductase
MTDQVRVLFLCVGNSCRSQMAEGLLRHMADDRFEVKSAGIIPSYVHPRAVQVMAELGIDISNQRSKHVREFTGQSFDYVISLCGEDNCPSFIGEIGTSLHWPFPDPVSASGTEEEILQRFRSVRDAIKERLEEFVGNPDSFSSTGFFMSR